MSQPRRQRISLTVFGVPLFDEHIRYIMQNSPERMINTAIKINEDLNASKKHEDGGVNLEDLNDSKQLITWMWNAFRSDIYKQLHKDIP